MSGIFLANINGPGPFNQLIEMGGPVMFVLFAIALVGVTTFVYLMLSGVFFAPRFTPRLKQAVSKWRQKRGRDIPDELLRRGSRFARLNPLFSLVANTMHDHLNGADAQRIREAVARDVQNAMEPFEAPLKIIEVIAALAPLLGLLGTVLGMMEAFSTMAAAEGRANATQLSGGIYQALTTTAAGLVIAIPFAALAAWIEFRLRKIQKTVNSALVTVLSVPSIRAVPGQATQRVDDSGTEYQDRLAHATG